MTLYRVPNKRADWRTVHIIGWSAVIFLLGVLAVSIHEPMELGDSGRRTLAWIAAAAVLSSVILAMVLASHGGLRRLKEGFQFEVANSKIIQSNEGQQAVEIPLVQIESLHEHRGWLVIRGGEPSRQITIPSEVNDFEELKQELAAYRTVTTLKARFRLVGRAPLALLIVACFYFFTSHKTAVVMTAGGSVLLLQVLGFYSILRSRRSASRPMLLLVTEILLWLVTAWIVYERTIGAM